MKQTIKEKIQMHIDEARKLAAEAGMDLEDFMNGENEMEEEEGYEDKEQPEEPMMGGPKGPDKGKIALIIAKMKKPKGE